ncbi:hypothetical protein V8G54_020070 [Vigna mungo]|uniref:Uncharacterized protein n=1 Tax=Vigna mungo TaxID=3915 RepID=A0AAQ3RW27_VIGMU
MLGCMGLRCSYGSTQIGLFTCKKKGGVDGDNRTEDDEMTLYDHLHCSMDRPRFNVANSNRMSKDLIRREIKSEDVREDGNGVNCVGSDANDSYITLQILKDEATREQYDYAIAHPEEVLYNTARYYHTMVTRRLKSCVRGVKDCILVAHWGHMVLVPLGSLNLIPTIVHSKNRLYLPDLCPVKGFGKSIRKESCSHGQETPAYKNKLRALELERSGGITNKKNTVKKVEQDLSNELDLQITGAERASVWKLLGVRFVLLPYTLGKHVKFTDEFCFHSAELLLWSSCWFWRYRVKKHSYSWEDASYLTQRSLGIPLDRWRHIDEATKEDLVLKCLWEKSNMESYVAEMQKESKRRR